MAYEVTATRKRPQQFSDLVGQEFVASTLKNSIQLGKIAHAYLFTGPRGCGKTSTARILSKALNCAKGPTATPCGECQQCKEITLGSSLDVIEIDGASNTSINDIRQIKDEILYPPLKSRYKIYIIDEVHMLSNGAFNALLKTIEEPPPYVIFIFATTELHKVPATIKSRCQQFNFRLVAIEEVKKLLASAAKESGVEAEDEALYWIARESTGSIRDSYTLFDQVLAFSGAKITWEGIKNKLGLLGIDRLNELFSYLAQDKPKEAMEFLDTLLASGISIEQVIIDCTEYLRSLLLLSAGVTKESLLGQSKESFSQSAIASWSAGKIQAALDLFLRLFRDVRYSVSARYELELSLSRLCHLKDYVSNTELRSAIEAAGSLLSQAAPLPASPTGHSSTNVAQGLPRSSGAKKGAFGNIDWKAIGESRNKASAKVHLAMADIQEVEPPPSLAAPPKGGASATKVATTHTSSTSKPKANAVDTPSISAEALPTPVTMVLDAFGCTKTDIVSIKPLEKAKAAATIEEAQDEDAIDSIEGEEDTKGAHT